MMKSIQIQDKNISVFDNLFSYDYKLSAVHFMRNSLFRLGWNDTQSEIGIKNYQLYSSYNEADLKALAFFDSIKDAEFHKMLSGYTVEKAIVNLSKPMDLYECHTYTDNLIVLYYANTKWESEWAGETLFFNDDLSEVEYTSIYKPGRVIVFDGSIPHTIRPPSIAADSHRFTLSIVLSKNKACSLS